MIAVAMLAVDVGLDVKRSNPHAPFGQMTLQAGYILIKYLRPQCDTVDTQNPA